MQGPEKVLTYLDRYVHRMAITDRRILPRPAPLSCGRHDLHLPSLSPMEGTSVRALCPLCRTSSLSLAENQPGCLLVCLDRRQADCSRPLHWIPLAPEEIYP